MMSIPNLISVNDKEHWAQIYAHQHLLLLETEKECPAHNSHLMVVQTMVWLDQVCHYLHVPCAGRRAHRGGSLAYATEGAAGILFLLHHVPQIHQKYPVELLGTGMTGCAEGCG